LLASVMLVPNPAMGQNASPPAVAAAASVAPPPVGPGSDCELHIFPTLSFISLRPGLKLEGNTFEVAGVTELGILGGVAGSLIDSSLTAKKAKRAESFDDVIKHALTEETQVTQLVKAGAITKLDLTPQTTIVSEIPFLSKREMNSLPSK